MLNKLNYNFSRYIAGQSKGHYESFFQRANHPNKPFAFWIRYTVFNPLENPDNAIGELWAIFFNGNTNEHISVKTEFPMSKCDFNNNSFNVNVGDAIINNTILKGTSTFDGNSIEWNLSYKASDDPLYLFPKKFYDMSFPKAKALVGVPLANYSGEIIVNDNKWCINNWIGSQNHNWGSQHTDRYAWGQVAGFDNYPNSFLEIATAQIKVGGFYIPKMTIAVIRVDDKEYLFNSLIKSIINKATYKYFEWNFSLSNGAEKLTGTIKAEKQCFVGLNYYNPPGGNKTCLNTKIAFANVSLTLKNGEIIDLLTNNKAAFEILTNDNYHGIQVNSF